MTSFPLSGDARGEEPAAYQTKTTYVLSRLRELIIGGELTPGTRILPRDLAQAFHVSATPVREAILQLQSEGYIESSPHMGAQVADWRGDDVEEVFDLRSMLEARLTRRAVAHLRGEDLAELRRVAADFRAAAEQDDFNRARQVNHRLHRMIWERAQQPLTLDMVNRLWARFPWEIMNEAPGRALRSADEHDSLLDALEQRDADAVERLVHEHVHGGYDDALKAGLVEKRRDPA